MEIRALLKVEFSCGCLVGIFHHQSWANEVLGICFFYIGRSGVSKVYVYCFSCVKQFVVLYCFVFSEGNLCIFSIRNCGIWYLTPCSFSVKWLRFHIFQTNLFSYLCLICKYIVDGLKIHFVPPIRICTWEFPYTPSSPILSLL